MNEQEKKIEELQKENDMFFKMFLYAKQLNEKHEEEELIRHLVYSIQTVFEETYVVFYSHVDNDREYGVYMEKGKKEKMQVPVTIPVEKGNYLMVSDTCLRTLVKVRGKQKGIIALYRPSTIPFYGRDFDLLLLYLEQFIERMRQVEEYNDVLRVAQKDKLTGLLNNKKFLEKFELFIKMAQTGEELTLITLNIDHFKAFNEKNGYDAGDEVLKTLAQIIKYNARKVDIVARMTGIEFGILVLNSKQGASFIAERIKKNICSNAVTKKLNYTLGIAHYGDHGESINAMYKATRKNSEHF